MITIFAIPRPFQGHFNIIQRNGIRSWTLLKPKCEIILLGNEVGTAKVAKESSACHISEVARNEFGTPLLNDMFALVQKVAKGEIIAMLNPDIILMSDFTKAVKQILQEIQKKPFLMVGQRWNLNIKEPIQFDEGNWEQKLRERIAKEGKLLGPSGMDYLVFPRSLQINPPPIIMGRVGVDNWLVYWAKSHKIPVIDATKVVDIVHQNHDYPKKKKNFYKIENQRNIKAIGGFSKMATLRDVDLLLTKEGLKKLPFLRRIFGKLTLFYPWRTLLGIKRAIQFKI